ncbi:MAG TPA: hypothetical protein VH008_12495, partial [Pseudonocardia sp.]|nr:hypothetical protein [Pseudonocardia sp.]
MTITTEDTGLTIDAGRITTHYHDVGTGGGTADPVLMGAPGVGMTITEGLKALRGYQPSEHNMRERLLSCFAVDKSIITDDLVRTRYEASIAPGAFEAYRDMFFSPKHAGSQL